jgi:hypothetical protein
MKKLLAVLLLVNLITVTVSAQSFFSRIYIGGSGGMNISNDYTHISIHPMVGYRITDIFSTGIVAVYEHSYGKGISYTANYYGGGVFGRAEAPLLPGFGLVGHLELNFLRRDVTSNGNTWSDNRNSLPAGVGIYIQTGRARVSLTALWDVFHLSQYSSGGPTLRVSVTF